MALLGLSFKPNTDDIRESPAMFVLENLLSRGATVRVYDPAAMDNARRIRPEAVYCSDPYEVAEDADLLVILTEWNQFRALEFERLRQLLRASRRFSICANLYEPERVADAGLRYSLARARRRRSGRHRSGSEGLVSQPLSVVTGGAGFIGSHLCERLLAEGHRVYCVDNFITGSPANIEHLRDNERFTLIEHDVSKPVYVGPDVDNVLHFASPASPVDYLELPIQTLKVGSLGTHNSLGLAKHHGARYLLASTSEVYGDPLVHPQPGVLLGQREPGRSRGVYDEAKRFAEAMVMAYHRIHGLDTRIVRIFNTYGPRMRLRDGRVVPNFIRQALSGRPMSVYGDGSQTRSFCYIDDLVEGVLAASQLLGRTDPVNLGNPREMTVLEFASVIRSLTGSRSEIEFQSCRRRPEDAPARHHPRHRPARLGAPRGPRGRPREDDPLLRGPPRRPGACAVEGGGL